MAKIVHIKGGKEPYAPSRDGGGGGGGDDMRELTERVAKLETDVQVIKATMATKDDLSKVVIEMHKGFTDVQKSITGATGKYIGWMFLMLSFYVGVTQALPMLLGH